MLGAPTLTHRAITLMTLLVLMHLGSFLVTYVFERQEAEADRLADASKAGEMLIERSNMLVHAITMESLAIYASPTWDEAKPYAAEISLHLGELDAVAKRLPTASVENESAAITSARKHIDDFIAFRTVLARLAQETGVAAARSFGDNEANRRYRQALIVELEGLSARYAKYSEMNDALSYLWNARTTKVAEISAALPFLAIFLGVFLLSHIITRPLERITASILAVAEGDLGAEIHGVLRKDEIGSIARAVVAFRDSIVANRRLERTATEQRAKLDEERGKTDFERRKDDAEHAALADALSACLANIANGDLTSRIEANFAGRFQQIKVDFNSTITRLEEAMACVIDSTNATMSDSHKIAAASDDLSQGTEQQASNFEETTAAISEITETVQETAESTKHARAVVADAQSEGETSGEIARHTVEAMRKIERSSKEIGDIIGMIDEIAFQTNLLALNAGIEAARAGESGRGFAVVASEVRALAQRSADAAKQIKVLIATSSGEVDNGVKLVAQTSDSLARIVTKVSEIDAVVAEIATSAMGQAAGLQVVNNAVVKMNEVMTQQNAAVGQQVTAASQSLFLEIEELSELVAQFRVHRSDEGNTIQRARAA